MMQVKRLSGGILGSAAMVMVMACGQANTDGTDSSNESIEQPYKHGAKAERKKANTGKKKQRRHAQVPRHGRHGRHRGGPPGTPGSGNGDENGSATGGSTGTNGSATGGMNAGGRMGAGGATNAGGAMGRGGVPATGGGTWMGTGGAWSEPSVCGDGWPEGYETCDDGNAESADGCSADCQVELGWACPEFGMPCHEVVCGDGQADWYEVETEDGYIDYAYEECDDGNTVDGDGCTSECTAEVGYYCETAGEPCRRVLCGDGLQDSYVVSVGGSTGTVWDYELCDDGNNDSSDGCSADCIPEPGFMCYGPGEPCTAVVCGDGRQDSYVAEVIVNEPSGAAGAPDGAGGASNGTGGVLGTGGVGGAFGGGPAGSVMIRYGWEQCDDGNATDADGCSATCQVESGYVCSEPGQPCHQPVCGDGFQDYYFVPGSGDAAGAPGEGTGGVYGRGGMIGYGGRGIPGSADYGTYVWEACDDGNTADGDGCSATCDIESGWVCLEPDQPCVVSVCGDGFEDYLTEECDDGNTVDGDGCSATCTYEW
jgi:cysteine-rich repeat protein